MLRELFQYIFPEHDLPEITHDSPWVNASSNGYLSRKHPFLNKFNSGCILSAKCKTYLVSMTYKCIVNYLNINNISNQSEWG